MKHLTKNRVREKVDCYMYKFSNQFQDFKICNESHM